MTPAPPYKEGPHRQAGRTRRLGEVVDNEAWGSGGQQRRCRGVPRTGRLGALRRRAGGRGPRWDLRGTTGVRAFKVDASHTGTDVLRVEPSAATIGASWGTDTYLGATRLAPTWGPPGWADDTWAGRFANVRLSGGRTRTSVWCGASHRPPEEVVTAHRSTRQRSRLAARAHHRRVHDMGICQLVQAHVADERDDADGHKPPVLLHRVRRVLHLDHLRPAGAGRVRCPSGPWQPLRAWAWRAPSVLLVRST